MLSKACKRCGEEKPATVEFFAAQKGGKFGLRSLCRPCKYASDLEYMGDYGKRYYLAHRDELLAANTRRYAEKREQYGATQARYAAKNRAAISAYHRRWRHNNPERWREIVKAYTARNPDVRRVIGSNRRARAAGLTESAAIRHVKRLIEAQKGRCWWCQKRLTDYHLDHRIPLAKGGGNGPNNLVLACPTCNLRKSSKNALANRQSTIALEASQ